MPGIGPKHDPMMKSKLMQSIKRFESIIPTVTNKGKRKSQQKKIKKLRQYHDGLRG